MKKNIFLLLAIILLIAPHVTAEISVFDQPALNSGYMQLMALMERAYEKKDFEGMEQICRAGYKLGMEQSLWLYNIACAQAMQCKTNDAMETLERAYREGYREVEHTQKDSDLKCLFENSRFKALLKKMAEDPTPPHPPMSPVDQVVSHSETNTTWDIRRTVFFAGIDASSQIKQLAQNKKRQYSGPLSKQILFWEEEGTADTQFPLLYINRDGNNSYFKKDQYPELLFLQYPQAMIQREQHIGEPNSIYYNVNNMLYFPVVGSCGMAVIRPDFTSSLVNVYALDQQAILRQSLIALANQLYFYAAGTDYTKEQGDQLYFNFPLSISVAGNAGAEKKFVEASIAAVAAMQPSVRDILTTKGMLGLALNKLIRTSQKAVKKPEDYLTGAAHPPVFEPDQLDVEKMVRQAHALDIYQTPPPTFGTVEVSKALQADSDLPPLRSEILCDTPLCKCMAFRGHAYTRRYTIQTKPENKSHKIHWVCLQGLPGKVRLTADPKVPNQIIADVDYHPIFEQTTPGGKKIRTSRVDIAAISEHLGSYSIPIVFSIFFLPDETRQYAPDGKLVSVDYTIPQADFHGKKLQVRRNWKDVFHYDKAGGVNGWARYRGLTCDHYTKEGYKIIERDQLGRPTIVHEPEYLARVEQIPQEEGSKEKASKKRIDLAEFDNGASFQITYKNDQDREGEMTKR